MSRLLLFLFAAFDLLNAQSPVELSCPLSAAVSSIRQNALAALGRRDYTTAIRLYREAADSCPSDRSLELELANAYFMAQRLPEAKTAAEQILKQEPASPAALEIKGNAEYLEGNTRSAIGTFIDLLERHPENQEAPYMLGRIYYSDGSVDQAIGQFQRLLKLNPHSFKGHDGLGLCLAAKGNQDEALRHFLTAIKLIEQDHVVADAPYADLAELLLRTGDPDKAFAAASKAADRNPYAARNFYLGGKALDQLGKIDLSRNWLERSAALNPNYPEPEYLLARIYQRLGLSEQAAQAQRKFLESKARTRK